MDDPAQYKNRWMKYATPEEIAAYFEAQKDQPVSIQRTDGEWEEIDQREEELQSTRNFGRAMDGATDLLAQQGKSRDGLTEELAYFGSTRIGYEYYHACRVIYRIGVEAEDMWKEVQGGKKPTDDLLQRLQNKEYRAESESKDEVIFNRLKRAIDEEVADRPGCTPGRDGGLRYIFNIEHILQNDPWARDVQRKLISMNQWTNAMMYAYDRILEKLYRTDQGSFNLAVDRHNNFRGHGYWDDGEYIALEDKIKEYREISRVGEK